MKVFYVFFIVFFSFFSTSCITKTEIIEEYFVWCDGGWEQIDENPMADEEVVKNDEDKIVPDEDQIIPDSPIITDSDSEVDEDFFEEVTEPDEDEEISRDFDYPEIPDEDMCENPCILLKDKYDSWLGKDKDSGELMSLSIIKENCACQTYLVLEKGYRESFYGYFFPVVSEIKNTLELGAVETEIIFTTKADGKKRYFEKQ